MLDQNTDRMWYVIGAVIVGAALIFILNGTMPDLFASVGGTFVDKTNETTEMVDGIMPYGKLLNPDTSTPNTWLYAGIDGVDSGIGTDEHTRGGTINPVPSIYSHSTSKIIPVDMGADVHFVKETVESTPDQYWRVSFMDKQYNYHSRWVSTTNDWVLTIPDGVFYFRVSYPTDSNPSIVVVSDK